MSESDHEILKSYAIRKAQEEAEKSGGLKVGDLVCHKDDDLTVVIREIEGEIATVWIPGNPNSVKKFPLQELYDARAARRAVLERYHSHFLKLLGGSSR